MGLTPAVSAARAAPSAVCSFCSLDAIELLEGHVRSSQALVAFLSASRSTDGTLASDYFTSTNCLREIRCAVADKLPVIFCLETDPRHGGAPLSVHLEACPSDLCHLLEQAIASRAVVPWVRYTQFQHASLRSMLAAVLPRRTDREDKLYMPSDIERQKLCLPCVAPVESPGITGSKRSHLYVCAANVGASEVAASLAAYASAQGASLRITTGQGLWREAGHILLYLNAATFDNSDDRCEALVAELEAVLRQGQTSLLLCHEQRETHDARSFDAIMNQTPQRLLHNGIYASGLATPLYALGTEHGQISLRLMLRDLEASDRVPASSWSRVASLCCPTREMRHQAPAAAVHWSRRVSKVSTRRLLAVSTSVRPIWRKHSAAVEPTAPGATPELSLRRQTTGSSRESVRQLSVRSALSSASELDDHSDAAASPTSKRLLNSTVTKSGKV